MITAYRVARWYYRHYLRRRYTAGVATTIAAQWIIR